MSVLRPFQEEGVLQIYRFGGRALLADEQGLGKTIQALAWVDRIRKCRPVAVICPSSMKYTWRAEAAAHFKMRMEVLEGRYHHRSLIPLPGNLVILNYDIVADWLPVLLRAKIQCLILDEVHYLRDRQSIRTQAVMELAKGCRSVVGLSGTPFTHRPYQLWPVLAVIRPDLFPHFGKFAWRYCRPKLTPWGWQYRGATNVKELNEVLLENVMIRRLKKEVAPELPKKIRKIVWLRLKNYREYRRAENDFIGWLRSIDLNRANRAKKAMAMSKVGYLLRLTAELKMTLAKRWIEEFLETNPGIKLVAMAMNTSVIEEMHRHFGSRSVIINGAVTGKMRAEVVRRFQSGKKIDLLFGNWKAAGVGITLHAAHHLAALDLPWTSGDLVQGEDRIHRIGQKREVMVHYLVVEGSIEEKILTSLRRQSIVLDSVLDGRASSISEAFLETLLKNL